jgi:hypothetical protein
LYAASSVPDFCVNYDVENVDVNYDVDDKVDVNYDVENNVREHYVGQNAEVNYDVDEEVFEELVQDEYGFLYYNNNPTGNIIFLLAEDLK